MAVSCSRFAKASPIRSSRARQVVPRVYAKSGSATSTPDQAIKCSGSAAVLPAFAAAVATATALATSAPALASSDKIGEFTASGFLFKDTVLVNSFEDPDVAGVTLYVSNFDRSIVDKLAKDFFSEPSQASLSCAVTGPVTIMDVTKLEGKEGHEVFSEKKGLNIFKDKTLRVRRLYDAKHNTLVYVAYSTRLSNAADEKAVSSGRYRTSLCAVKLPQQAAPEVAASS